VEQGPIRTTLAIHNGAIVAGTLVGGEYELALGSTRVIRGDFPALTLRAGQTAPARLETFSPAWSVPAQPRADKSLTATVVLRGVLRLRVLRWPLSVPIRAEAPLQIQLRESASTGPE
jgi:hypothetical protein